MKDSRLKLCPFCGEEIEIVPLDKDLTVMGDDFLCNHPNHVIGFALYHAEKDDNDCAIANYGDTFIGAMIYDTIDEAVERWNIRSLERD